MAKNLNKVEVNLAFSADTGQAKAQLRELKNLLSFQMITKNLLLLILKLEIKLVFP